MRKLRSAVGASLAETLVTILLLSIILSAVVAGIPAVMSAYREVRLKADAQTLLATAVTAVTDELRYAENVQYSSDYSFYSSKRSATIELVSVNNAADSSDNGIYVRKTNAAADENSKDIPLLTKQTQTLGLYASLTPGSMENGCIVYTVSVISSDGKVIESTPLKVRPISSYQG
jgi:Tfp pilus assembly protein PilV